MKTWSDMDRTEREKAVLSLSGSTASFIGRRLGTSRDAIISFVRRYRVDMRWGGNQAAVVNPQTKTAIEQDKRAKLAAARQTEAEALAEHEARMRVEETTRIATPGAWGPVAGVSRPAPLHELGAHCCSWPLWRHDNEPKLFCGGDTDRQRPYCRPHERLAYPIRARA